MSKLKIAAYSAAGCGGCDIAMLEIHEAVLELDAAADILMWPTVVDGKYDDIRALPDGEIDVTLFNGAIRTHENREIAELLRRKSKAIVAFGACAAFGGIPGLSNLFPIQETLERAFGTESTDPGSAIPQPSDDPNVSAPPAMEERVGSLGSVVGVEYVIPGCAPESHQVLAVVQALITGTLPPPGVAGAGDRSVCDECPRKKRNVRVSKFVRPHQIVPEPDWCLLEQGIVCMGLATRSGCGAKCPSVSMPCRGCYGPAGDTIDQGAKMVAALGSLVDSEDEAVIAATLAEVVDPTGTFYCFTLPTSLLGGARTRTGEEARQ